MPKLRVKDLKPRIGDRKKLLWNRLMGLNLLVYSIKDPSRNIFLIITSDEVIDRLLTANVKESLAKDDFEVLIPPEYNAKKTIVLRNIDSLISTVDSEELNNDLESRNSWLKVQEVIKIPSAPKILKIKTEGSDMVKTACEKGVLIYNQSVPPTNVDREIFVYLSICYKCYQYSHATEDCPTPDVELCSECAAQNHTYRECRSTIKKCLNCRGDHRTFAARCPMRKKLIREKTKEIRERSRSRSRPRNQELTYAEAASNQNRQDKSRKDTEGSNREDYIKITSSLQYAFKVNEILQGTFRETIKEMYHLNGLPQVKFPAYIPPGNVNPTNVTEEIQKCWRAMKHIKEQKEQRCKKNQQRWKWKNQEKE